METPKADSLRLDDDCCIRSACCLNDTEGFKGSANSGGLQAVMKSESMRMRLQRRYLEKAKAYKAEPEAWCAPSVASDACLDDMLRQVGVTTLLCDNEQQGGLSRTD